MRKTLTLLAFTTLFASQAFASYVVVLRNGTRYVARSKWTLQQGKAIVQLENGQTLSLDPSLIDEAKSEQATKMGLTNASVIDLNATPGGTAASQEPSLGSTIKLRRGAQQQTPTEQSITPKANAPTAPPVATVPGALGPDVIDKFERAYENVGIFEHKVVSTGARSLRADMTVDTEDRVFNAISATAFLIVKNAGVSGAQIDVVELYMKTTVNGAAGRFQLTRADAEALTNHTISQQEYFVRKVIY
jgi:hypothetical protein